MIDTREDLLRSLAISIADRDIARADLAFWEDHIRRQVPACRAAGATWREIADVLGVTRQAAQQRYGIAGDDCD